MKEILIAVVAIIVISIAVAFGLDAMNWSAEGTFTTRSVRL